MSSEQKNKHIRKNYESKDDAVMQFAENLKKYRKALSMSQVKLADEAGISSRSIINYERGRYLPANQATADSLAKTLGVNPEELIPSYRSAYNTGYSASVSGTETSYEDFDGDAAEEIQKMISGIQALFAGGRLSPEDRSAAIKAIIEVIAEQ